VKILLRQTVAQEDHDATRKSSNGESQGWPCCLAISLVGEGFAWGACPAEASDWPAWRVVGYTEGIAKNGARSHRQLPAG
jgi:hypothetical protein